MLSSIGYAAGAEENALAEWLGHRIGQSVAHRTAARRALLAMRAIVLIVAPDRGLTVTLRFDHGQVTLHDGRVGVPDVTVCADFQLLEELGELELPSWRSLRRSRGPHTEAARARWLGTGAALLDGSIAVYGLVGHPRLVVRLLRLLSAVR